MEPGEYAKLAQYEGWYWWYRAQRQALIDAVGALRVRPGVRVLDAGCGSGRNLIELSRAFRVKAYGLDASAHAAALWNGVSNVHRSLGSVNELPYADASFDIVVSVDVIYCKQVEPDTAVREMARVLRPGGHLVVLVPAFSWLASRHDAAVHGVRRFTRAGLRSLIVAGRLNVERITYLFAPFFPAIAVARLLGRVRGGSDTSVPQSDLAPLPGWLNNALYAVSCAERHIGRYIPMPIGSTILGIARKEG